MQLLAMLHKGIDPGKSMKPLKDFRRSTAQSLHKRASATLGVEDLESAVKLPKGEDKAEWLAVHVVDFVRARLRCWCHPNLSIVQRHASNLRSSEGKLHA